MGHRWTCIFVILAFSFAGRVRGCTHEWQCGHKHAKPLTAVHDDDLEIAQYSYMNDDIFDYLADGEDGLSHWFYHSADDEFNLSDGYDNDFIDRNAKTRGLYDNNENPIQDQLKMNEDDLLDMVKVHEDVLQEELNVNEDLKHDAPEIDEDVKQDQLNMDEGVAHDKLKIPEDVERDQLNVDGDIQHDQNKIGEDIKDQLNVDEDVKHDEDVEQDPVNVDGGIEHDQPKTDEDVKQDQLKIDEDVKQDQLKIDEDVKQDQLKIDEDVKQDQLKIDEDVKQNPLKIDEDVKQGQLKIDEDVKQDHLQIDEHIIQDDGIVHDDVDTATAYQQDMGVSRIIEVKEQGEKNDFDNRAVNDKGKTDDLGINKGHAQGQIENNVVIRHIDIDHDEPIEEIDDDAVIKVKEIQEVDDKPNEQGQTVDRIDDTAIEQAEAGKMHYDAPINHGSLVDLKAKDAEIRFTLIHSLENHCSIVMYAVMILVALCVFVFGKMLFMTKKCEELPFVVPQKYKNEWLMRSKHRYSVVKME